MSKRILWGFAGLGVALVCLVSFFSFWQTDTPQTEIAVQEPLRVVASFFPYAEFARGVAGGDASITTLVPSGVEPHDFEPTPRDIEKLYQADVVIINGAGIDAWADKLSPELIKRGVRVVRMSDTLNLLPGQDDEHQNESLVALEEDKHEHDESAFDPHFWLDPVLAEIQVNRIKEVFKEVDPANQVQYEARWAVTTQELRSLDQEYTSGLSQCRLRSVVTAHDAFTYLAKRYTLEVISIAGLSPNTEPSPKRLVEIANVVRERNIGYIFFETLSSPKLSQTLARETGVETLVFNPIEGGMMDENGVSETYFSLMRQNLNHLRIALECL
jgi:zinc transport system substrate-binding protein